MDTRFKPVSEPKSRKTTKNPNGFMVFMKDLKQTLRNNYAEKYREIETIYANQLKNGELEKAKITLDTLDWLNRKAGKHSYDVVVKTKKFLPNFLPESGVETIKIDIKSYIKTMIFVARFHDLGRLEDVMLDGTIKYVDHALAGSKMIEQTLKTRKYCEDDEPLITIILLSIKYHQNKSNEIKDKFIADSLYQTLTFEQQKLALQSIYFLMDMDKLANMHSYAGQYKDREDIEQIGEVRLGSVIKRTARITPEAKIAILAKKCVDDKLHKKTLMDTYLKFVSWVYEIKLASVKETICEDSLLPDLFSIIERKMLEHFSEDLHIKQSTNDLYEIKTRIYKDFKISSPISREGDIYSKLINRAVKHSSI